MLKWYLDKDRNPVKMLILNLTEYKIYSQKLGYHAIKMNAHPVS